MKKRDFPFEAGFFRNERTEIVGSRDLWFRFERYGLAEHKGMILIIPDKEARLIEYNPFRESSILQEYLLLGKWFEDEIKSAKEADRIVSQKRVANKVLQFCNSYGLLGFIYELYDSRSDYISARKKSIYIETRINGRWTRCKFQSFAAPFFPNGAPRYALDGEPNEVMRGYAESAVEIAFSAFCLFYKAITWKFIREVQPPASETIQPPWTNEPISLRQFIVSLGVYGVDVAIFPHKEPRMDFLTNSLHQSLRMMFLLSLVSSDKHFRLCDECSTPFVAKDPRARFCGDRCSTRARQRRFLERHKSTTKTQRKSSAKVKE